MHGDYFDDFIPAMISSENLSLRSQRDMANLGKENLQFLIRFWKKRAEKMRAKVKVEPDFEKRGQFEYEANSAAHKASELKKIAEGAESKPHLFEKPTFETGSHVTCFLEQPDRYVSGILIKIKADTDEDAVTGKNAVFFIRVFDQSGQHTIEYAPDGFSLFMTDEFEYFKAHWGFFRLYLEYHTYSIPDRDKADRMLFCISRQPPPPEAA